MVHILGMLLYLQFRERAIAPQFLKRSCCQPAVQGHLGTECDIREAETASAEVGGKGDSVQLRHMAFFTH